MATLNVGTVGQAGADPALVAAAAGGDDFVNDGGTYLEVRNGGGGAIDVTVNSVKPCDQGFDHNQVTNIPAGENRIMGPFDTARFNAATGRVSVTYSGVADVTVRAFK